jgi:hypothetical protein
LRCTRFGEVGLVRELTDKALFSEVNCYCFISSIVG